MTLRLYSSLGREVRDFQPVTPGRVSMYVCGVTPYDVTHLGHAFSTSSSTPFGGTWVPGVSKSATSRTLLT